MAEEELKMVEPQAPSEPPPDIAEEKPVISPPSEEEENSRERKALAIVEKAVEIEGSSHRGRELARVETEKTRSLIRAWEESEKCRAENKAYKKLSAIEAWENRKIASTEAEMKKIEEMLEIEKAEYVEKMKNKIALYHKAAEEKRAQIEAKREQDILQTEELAAKYRAKGTTPRKLLSIF
ncbi:remorin isoform X2 [Eucalyptus grandis]|uniref:remorin isoform X2 n=1 Tax=Eucalyptus grandis TaxID=71139 RepID=UPI00192F03FB|nr:remorin isoform X2 [Eucalyptus grandis]